MTLSTGANCYCRSVGNNIISYLREDVFSELTSLNSVWVSFQLCSLTTQLMQLNDDNINNRLDHTQDDNFESLHCSVVDRFCEISAYLTKRGYSRSLLFYNYNPEKMYHDECKWNGQYGLEKKIASSLVLKCEDWKFNAAGMYCLFLCSFLENNSISALPIHVFNGLESLVEM